MCTVPIPASYSHLDVNIEQVSALAQRNALPEPNLSFSSDNIRRDTPRQNTILNPDDPWNNAQQDTPFNSNGFAQLSSVPSTIEGTGLPKDWWKRQERVTITTVGQQGFILNRYTVYQIHTEVTDPSFFSHCYHHAAVTSQSELAP